MAKESSAERVSPITRANYIGNSTVRQESDGYDPLAALANLVGSIEDDNASAKAQVPNVPEYDLESELIQDFQNVDNAVTQQNENYGEFEDGLSYALDAGLREQVTQPPVSDTPLEERQGMSIAAEPAGHSAAESVTFEQIFNAEPEYASVEAPATADPVSPVDPVSSVYDNHPPIELGDILSAPAEESQPDTTLMADELMQELDGYQQAIAENSNAPAELAPEVSVAPVEQAAPVEQNYAMNEISFAAQEGVESDPFAAVSAPFIEPQFEPAIEPVAANEVFEPVLAAEPALESEAPVAEFAPDADFAAEFEAAMSGNSEELYRESPIADEGFVIETQTPEVVEQPQFFQKETQYADGNVPFGTPENAVTMPPVSTPFDHQVDGALHDIIASDVPADNKLGWSGNLAGELEDIVSSAEEGAAVFATQEAPVVAEPEPAIYAPVDTAVYAEETATNLAANGAVDGQPETASGIAPEAAEGYSMFEQELAAQLNPEAGEDPFAAAPVAPEPEAIPPQKRSGLAVAAGVLGVAAVVAGGAFGWKYVSGGDVKTSVPTILASTAPVKIRPKEPGGVKVPNQDQIVYEKVNGKSEDKTSQERLTSGSEAPIRVVSTDASPPMVEPLPEAGANPSPSAIKSDARIAPNTISMVGTERAIISPRKVRTVIVRPDGTIVAAKQDSPVFSRPKKVKQIELASTNKVDNFVQPLGNSASGSVPKAVAPVVGTPAVAPSSTESPINKDKLGGLTRSIVIAPLKPANSGGDRVDTPTATAKTPIVKPLAIEAPRKVVVRPVKRPPPVQQSKPVSKPVKLATASSGSYVMQISSQRSAEAAQSSYNRLSRRFSGILGGRGVDIRRFNIKDKGIYYRVRVPVGTRKAAVDLCVRYKDAGGSCFVTR